MSHRLPWKSKMRHRPEWSNTRSGFKLDLVWISAAHRGWWRGPSTSAHEWHHRRPWLLWNHHHCTNASRYLDDNATTTHDDPATTDFLFCMPSTTHSTAVSLESNRTLAAVPPRTRLGVRGVPYLVRLKDTVVLDLEMDSQYFYLRFIFYTKGNGVETFSIRACITRIVFFLRNRKFSYENHV